MWTIAWSPSPAIAPSYWGLGRETSVTIDADTVERLDPMHAVAPGVRGSELVQVDRTGCSIHVVSTLDVTFSDDAGSRREDLVIDLDLRGDPAVVGGRYQVEDDSENPPIAYRGSVTGRAQREVEP